MCIDKKFIFYHIIAKGICQSRKYKEVRKFVQFSTLTASLESVGD